MRTVSCSFMPSVLGWGGTPIPTSSAIRDILYEHLEEINKENEDGESTRMFGRGVKGNQMIMPCETPRIQMWVVEGVES